MVPEEGVSRRVRIASEVARGYDSGERGRVILWTAPWVLPPGL